MTTVTQIITLALKDINVLGTGETASADDTADCLATLNQMIGQWQVQKMYVYAQKEASFSADGSQTYTIGTGGAVNVALPPTIDAAFYRVNSVDTPITVLTSFEDFENIAVKSVTGIPDALFFQRIYPLGTLHVWPQPSTGTIHLITRQTLTSYTSLTNDLTLPDEYVLAVRYSLAELIAPSYGATVSNEIKLLAKSARTILKRNNLNVPRLGVPASVLTNGRYSITTDR
jgi:hypothetical protein